jgi:hypothetical protein
MGTMTFTEAQLNDFTTMGVECEGFGISRERAAQVAAEVLQGRVSYHGGTYSEWRVYDRDNAAWAFRYDSSIPSNNSDDAVELVTPVLRYADLPRLQQVVRALKCAGLRTDPTQCGVHVHLGASPLTGFALGNLARLVYSREAHIFAGLQVAPARRRSYTKDLDGAFLHDLAAHHPATREDLARMWYGMSDEYSLRSAQQHHYHESRYGGLNLHSVFFRGTAEFRWFNGTLHAGQIKAYVQLCYCLALKAMLTKRAFPLTRYDYDEESAKYDLRRFLVFLGMNGEEFATARKLLTDHLPGNGNAPGDRRTARLRA